MTRNFLLIFLYIARDSFFVFFSHQTSLEINVDILVVESALFQHKKEKKGKKQEIQHEKAIASQNLQGLNKEENERQQPSTLKNFLHKNENHYHLKAEDNHNNKKCPREQKPDEYNQRAKVNSQDFSRKEIKR